MPFYIVNRNTRSNGDHEVHEKPQRHSKTVPRRYPSLKVRSPASLAEER